MKRKEGITDHLKEQIEGEAERNRYQDLHLLIFLLQCALMFDMV